AGNESPSWFWSAFRSGSPRATPTTCAPAAVSEMAVWRPKPRLEPVTIAVVPDRLASVMRISFSVSDGGHGALPRHGGRGDFPAPDEQERDRDGGQRGEPADPERPLESAGERGRRRVSQAQQVAGVGRGDGGGDRYPP